MDWIYNITYALTFGIAFYYFYLKARKSIHILQLNSYRDERYGKWMNQNAAKVYFNSDLLPILGAIIAVFFPLIGLAVAVLSYLLLIRLRPQIKEKKPLVVTDRVKRLMRTIYGISGIVFLMFGVFLYSYPYLAILCIVLWIFTTFWVVRFGNRINVPIENNINLSFYKQAQQKVKSASDLLVIGITGSYGKTSVKHAVTDLLSHKFNVLMTPGSYNTAMGVTRIINDKLNPLHEIFVAEMGAKQRGDIKELVDLASPKIGILTAIGPAHLETFGSLEITQKTKYELIDGLPKDGVAFMNYDNERVRECVEWTNVEKYTYSASSDKADFYASDLNITSKGSHFKVNTPDGQSIPVLTKLLGEHNISNVVVGVAVAHHLGVSHQQISGIVRTLKPAEHRLQLKKTAAGITILDDAFNSNPVGSKAAVEVLRQIEGNQKILVTPGMVELGEQEYELNYQFGVHASKNADYIILVGQKQTEPIQKALKDEGFNESNLFVAKDFFEGNAHLQSIAKKGDVVLFENDLPDTYNE